MNQSQMKKRCPDSRLLGRVVLHEHKIDFTIYSSKRLCGCADVVETPGGKVWGLLYEIGVADLESLDRIEGHPVNYQRCSVDVVDDCGTKHTALTYKVVTKHPSTLKTSKHYLTLLQDSAKANNFPEEYQRLLSTFATLD